MLLQEMVVEIHGVKEAITENTLHLAGTLHHLLTDAKLGVFHLLHFP